MPHRVPAALEASTAVEAMDACMYASAQASLNGVSCLWRTAYALHQPTLPVALLAVFAAISSTSSSSLAAAMSLMKASAGSSTDIAMLTCGPQHTQPAAGQCEARCCLARVTAPTSLERPAEELAVCYSANVSGWVPAAHITSLVDHEARLDLPPAQFPSSTCQACSPSRPALDERGGR